MNKYFVSELLPGTMYAAGSQREDIESILKSEGYKPILIPPGRSSFFSRLSLYINTIRALRTLSKPGVVLFHFPVRSRALRYFQKLSRKKGLCTIAYEIDLEGLRDNDNNKLRRELTLLNSFDVVITQNNIKKEIIETQGGHKKVIIHEMHDYLGVECVKRPERKHSKNICYAGNLEKAPFIHLLGKLEGVSFYIYGQTENTPAAGNIFYKGKEDPRLLPCIMEGSFGLVWDGSSIETGLDAGYYLRYNLPHKTGLYVMAGLPLIVWTESAIAGWVEQHNIGIAVGSLYEIEERVSAISETHYKTFCVNLAGIQKKMSSGYYLRSALNQAESLITTAPS